MIRLWFVQNRPWSDFNSFKDGHDQTSIRSKLVLIRSWFVQKSAVIRLLFVQNRPWLGFDSIKISHDQILISWQSAMIRLWLVQYQSWSDFYSFRFGHDQTLSRLRTCPQPCNFVVLVKWMLILTQTASQMKGLNYHLWSVTGVWGTHLASRLSCRTLN